MKSTYRNGAKSYQEAREILRARYGDKVADEYEPSRDLMTMRCLNAYGLRVKRGEQAIRVTIICERKNKDGEVLAKFPRKVNLFHVGLQCERVGE